MTTINKENKYNKNIEDKQNKDLENKYIDPIKIFTNKELMHYKMIEKYFKSCSEQDILKMVDIINSTSVISLRILDWFVTRYSKKNIDFDCSTTGEIFDVHISYKAQLKSYKKRYFDPFRRRKKFHFSYDPNDKSKKLYTTLGQLNFFKWAFTNNIINFVELNINHVTKEMNQSNKNDKKKKDKKKDKIKKIDKIKNNFDNKNSLNSDIDSLNSKNKSNIIVSATKIFKDDEVQLIVSFD